MIQGKVAAAVYWNAIKGYCVFYDEKKELIPRYLGTFLVAPLVQNPPAM